MAISMRRSHVPVCTRALGILAAFLGRAAVHTALLPFDAVKIMDDRRIVSPKGMGLG